MAEDLVQLEHWASKLLARLDPRERRALARTIATDLRRSQQRRIAAQVAPDGTPYLPRKTRTEPLRTKRGAIRRKQAAMFAKLRTARWLKINATADSAEVGFMGRVARLARVHQEGLEDRPRPGAKPVRYPVRPLLGFSDADRQLVRNRLVDHLGAGGVF